MKTKVLIDSRVNILYSSYYIYGLKQVFGKENVSFSGSKKLFGEINWYGETHSHDHFMPFVVINEKKNTKIIIDFRDKSSIKESAYIWCDKYAKVNYKKEITDINYQGKAFSIAPGFGIHIWNYLETAFYCILNIIKSNFSIPVNLRRYIGVYWLQLRRPKLEYFTANVISIPNYIFFISTLWQRENTVKTTNVWRKNFIESCIKNKKIKFEGGLYSSLDNPQYNDYKDIVYTKRYPTAEYLSKIKRSLLVFNTPSVHDCHGWKLGEFLAMGKAIISSRLSNDLPYPLIHGENIHFVKDSSEIEEAIEMFVCNDKYKEKLEQGSRSYYEAYVSPIAVINYIINKNIV